MKIIKALSKIVTPKRTRHVDILSFNLKKDSKLMRLYEGLRKDKFRTEEDAIISLYGDISHKYKFSKLKHDLRKRIFNTLHLIKVEDQKLSKIQSAMISCERAWTAIRLLIMFQSLKPAIYLLDKHFPKMIKYEFTLMILESAKLYKRYYSTIDANTKRVDYYDHLINQHLTLYIAETKIEGYLSKLLSLYSKDKGHKSAVENIAEDYLSEIKNIYPDVESSAFLSRLKMVEIIKYMSNYDYEKTINICLEALTILEKREVKRPDLLNMIYSQLTSCLLQTERYEEVNYYCEVMIKNYLREGEFNWFKTKELQFQLFIHTEQYQEAYTIYQTTTQHQNFFNLPSQVLEEWNIYRACLEFLNLNFLVRIDQDNSKSSFKLSKFLNEVPIFSKDKRGLNVAIILCQIQILIVKKKYNAVSDRIEAIEKYASRYLKSDYHFRTRCLIKIITVLEKGGFDARLIEWDEIASLKHAMSEKPVDIINPQYDLEIIRYEKIVDLLIAHIEM